VLSPDKVLELLPVGCEQLVENAIRHGQDERGTNIVDPPRNDDPSEFDAALHAIQQREAAAMLARFEAGEFGELVAITIPRTPEREAQIAADKAAGRTAKMVWG